MMDLREKVFIRLCALRGDDDERDAVADAILAIPEIRDALEHHSVWIENKRRQDRLRA